MIYETSQGDDETLELTILDQDGVAINITNYGIKLTVWDPLTKEILITKTSAIPSEIQKVTPASGRADVYIASSDTVDMKGAYEFDVQLTSAGGAVQTVDKDIFVVKEDISAP
jgi:hypothetical protein